MMTACIPLHRRGKVIDMFPRYGTLLEIAKTGVERAIATDELAR
jgi:hypothetical protein